MTSLLNKILISFSVEVAKNICKICVKSTQNFRVNGKVAEMLFFSLKSGLIFSHHCFRYLVRQNKQFKFCSSSKSGREWRSIYFLLLMSSTHLTEIVCLLIVLPADWSKEKPTNFKQILKITEEHPLVSEASSLAQKFFRDLQQVRFIDSSQLQGMDDKDQVGQKEKQAFKRPLNLNSKSND